MKKIIFILFIAHCSLLIVHAQSGWVQQNSGIGYTLNSLFFIDSNIGYVVGDTSISNINFFIILKTTNGGLNWLNQTPPFPNNQNSLKSVFFLNALTGYACGGGYTSNYAYVIKTTNGGMNWNAVYNQSGLWMQSLTFFDALTGIGIGGSNMRFFRTTDGGNNWSNYFIVQNNGPLKTMCFPDALTGYSAGPDTNIYKTTNAGLNWFQLYYVGPSINSIYFINVNTGWIAGGPILYNFYKTTNGGINWIPSPIFNAELNSVRFVNSQTGWVCSSGGGIYVSTNAGNNWALQTTGITTSLRSLYFIDAQTGWAVGDNGRILKTTTGGFVPVKPISNEIPEQFKLYQNYPNPFNPTTFIKFEIPNLPPNSSTRDSRSETNQKTEIRIFDISGKEAAALVNEYLNPGIYQIEFNGTNFPSGIYFYQLIISNERLTIYKETKRMVIVK